MKATKQILLITMVALTLVGCGKDGTSGTGKVEFIFSDSAVSNFSQTSGIAKIEKSSPQQMMEIVIPSAYAGEGNVSCLPGESISFTMDALNNNIDVTSTCSSTSTIDKDIRVGLLKSMNGYKMRRTVTEATYNGNDAVLNFSGGFSFGTAYTVPRNGGLPCTETYTFNSDGTVSVAAIDQSGVDTSGTHNTACGGAYTSTISFRFANGYLEFDLSGSRNFSTSHTMDDEGSLAGAYERFEVCGSIGGSVNNISTDTLPTSVGANNSNFQTIRNNVATTGNPVPCN